MFEKVNMYHPDKVADRVAGALVDLAYTKDENPKIAVEVLIGHGVCHIIAETSVTFSNKEVAAIVKRIAGKVKIDFVEVPQDKHLSKNQEDKVRCGDNGIFKGTVVTEEQKALTKVTKYMQEKYGSDGKYIISNGKLIICQSKASESDLIKDSLIYGFRMGKEADMFKKITTNPLGFWMGGTDVDCGATNRKLGSDMGDSVTGGGLHGKDLSKADVSVNIFAWLMAQKTDDTVELSCAIGDESIVYNGKEYPYCDIVAIAREYINEIGGFEKFAELGLIR